jgi:hypothetical protein
MAGRADPSGVRRTMGDVLGWIEDNDLVRPILGGLVVVVLLAGFVFVRSVAPDGRPDERVGTRAAASPAPAQPAPDEPDPIETDPIEPARTAAHENLLGGFGFAYPTTWNLIESGNRTFVESPDGRLLVGFGRAPGSSLEAGSERTVGRIVEGWSDHRLTGTTHEVIAGSRSLLVGGTVEEGEHARRFLAITVRARPHNFAISVLAPFGADPERVLPRIEEIVASFRMLGTAA